MSKWHRMKNILGFGLRTGAGAIHKNNLVAHPVHNQSEGRGRTDHSRAHDANFHSWIVARAVLGMLDSSASSVGDATRSRIVSFTLRTFIIWGPSTNGRQSVPVYRLVYNHDVVRQTSMRVNIKELGLYGEDLSRLVRRSGRPPSLFELRRARNKKAAP